MYRRMQRSQTLRHQLQAQCSAPESWGRQRCFLDTVGKSAHAQPVSRRGECVFRASAPRYIRVGGTPRGEVRGLLRISRSPPVRKARVRVLFAPPCDVQDVRQGVDASRFPIAAREGLWHYLQWMLGKSPLALSCGEQITSRLGNNRLLQWLDVMVPVLQSPMAGSRDHRLAAAVSSAGGLGAIPVAMLDAQGPEKQITQFRSLCSQPLNVNFFCHAMPDFNEVKDAAWRDRLHRYFVELSIAAADHAPTPAR